MTTPSFFGFIVSALMTTAVTECLGIKISAMLNESFMNEQFIHEFLSGSGAGASSLRLAVSGSMTLFGSKLKGF